MKITPKKKLRLILRTGILPQKRENALLFYEYSAIICVKVLSHILRKKQK